MLLESAEENIGIAIKGDEITRWTIEDVDDSLQKRKAKKVMIRTISEFDKHNTATIRRFLEFCDLRHVASLKTVPMTIIDSKEVLICLNGNTQSRPENAIWTNHPELVNMLASFFNVMWVNAKKHPTDFN